MTVTVFTITGSGNDTTAWYTHTDWPPFPSGTFADADNSGVVFVSKRLQATDQASVGLFRWDTSSIPDTDVIVAAVFKPYMTNLSADADDFSVVGDYFAWGGTPSVAGDFIETASPSIFTAVNLTGLTVQRYSWPLTDLTGISKTGFTEIRVTLSAGTPTGGNEVHFREYTGSHPTQYCQLEVTHVPNQTPPSSYVLIR